jgi:protein AbiQ
MINNLDFYEVNEDYVSYLQKVDSKIPNISYASNNKFVCGIMFEICGINYFAPVSSFQRKQQTNYLIKHPKGYVLSSIRFSFMFPVPNTEISIKNIKNERPDYRRLLNHERDFCINNQLDIIKSAIHIYNGVINNKSELLTQVCCDFKKLEIAYRNWNK